MIRGKSGRTVATAQVNFNQVWTLADAKRLHDELVWYWTEFNCDQSFRSVYAAKPMLSIGTGSTDKEHFTGIIDEVRLSSKALEPSEFLTMTRRPRGAMVLIRSGLERRKGGFGK